MLSLREKLLQIGEPRPGKALPTFRTGFHSAPTSLRAAMRAMDSPQPATWSDTKEHYFENHEWTEECQGLTTDGTHWFFSSNNDDRQAIYRFGTNFGLETSAEMPDGLGGTHIGDIDFRAGTIFVPVEPDIRVLMFDTSLSFLGHAKLKGSDGGAPPQTHMSWCAIHPWNGLLYSSNFDAVEVVRGYDPSNGFRLSKSMILDGGAVDSVQGGCISPHGHLCLTSGASKEIRVYSMLNGAFLGGSGVYVDDSWDVAEELEGIAIFPVNVGGVPSEVHVVVLDNDLTNEDDIYVKHYSVPLAANL